MTKKAQAAVEFYTYLAMFLVLLSIAMAVLLSVASAETQRYEGYVVDETAGRFADIITSVYVSGNGFTGLFYVPTDIAGQQYTVYFADGKVIVTEHSKNLTAMRVLPTHNIQDSAGQHVFSYTSEQLGADILVSNNNGIIKILP